MSLNSLLMGRLYLLCRTNLPRYKAGSGTQASSTFEVTAQEVVNSRRLLRRLAGSRWGASATVLRTATLASVHFTAHLFGVAVLTVASLKSQLMTPCAQWPASHSNGQLRSSEDPTELCRQVAILSLAHCTQEPEHLRQLKLRNSFVLAALELLNDLSLSQAPV